MFHLMDDQLHTLFEGGGVGVLMIQCHLLAGWCRTARLQVDCFSKCHANRPHIHTWFPSILNEGELYL